MWAKNKPSIAFVTIEWGNTISILCEQKFMKHKITLQGKKDVQGAFQFSNEIL